jgi:hypothetical protein
LRVLGEVACGASPLAGGAVVKGAVCTVVAKKAGRLLI